MKKIFYLVIAILLTSVSLAIGDQVCGLPMLAVATMHETTFGNSERYRISSYFLPNSNSNFDTASDTATIEWNGNLYTYVCQPDFRNVKESFDRLMVAALYPTQSTPIELELLENVTYKLTVGNVFSNCEFLIPANSFYWLDIPYANYDQTTRTISWIPIDKLNVSYNVRIYPPLLDGSPNIYEPLFNQKIKSGETNFTLPNTAPALPGYYIVIQASKFTSSLSGNYSRDFIKLPVIYTFDGKVVIQGN